jgi:hypothetical protein
MQVIVTLLENVVLDEDERFVYKEDGALELKSDENVGILLKTHVVPIQKLEDGVLITGLSPMAEVLWNEIRTPAPALVSPNELVWVSISEESDDYDQEEAEAEAITDFYETDDDDDEIVTN